MSTYNTTGEILSNSGAEQFDRANAAFIVPSTTSSLLEPYSTNPFSNEAPFIHGLQKDLSSTTHHTNTSSSYTFVQIKREPCQVSEVTTSNNCHQQTSSKTMSSTLTTLVKIESSSPKVSELEKSVQIANSSNSVPIGIAVARKRPQETINPPAQVQQSINKDNMNCFGIRVADIGGVPAGCGNIYFTGAGDLMTGSTGEELALSAAGVQSVNRAPSAFWPYSNAVPIESVISMSPATVGLQYSREASRGQVVLLPAPTTSLDPFSQAAAFVWPSYIPQGSAPLQPPPNFLFPSMSPHSAIQPQPYTPLQLFGSNYLTAAAAAAAATSSLCQHNQTSAGVSNNSSSSRFLSLSSESKRIDPIIKNSPLKLEEWNSENMSLRCSSLLHQNHGGITFERNKSKLENVSNLIQIHPQQNLTRLTTNSSADSHHQIQSQSDLIFQATPSPSPLLNLSVLPRVPMGTIGTGPTNFLSNPTAIEEGIPFNKNIEQSAIVPRTPQMQDVNIQTDTPVCSEDENSSGPLALQTIPNTNIILPTMPCEIRRSPLPLPQPSPPLESSSIVPSEQCHKETNFCNQMEENTKHIDPSKLSHLCNAEVESIPQTSSDSENKDDSCTENVPDNTKITVVLPPIQSSPVDLTGLELLSNISASSFANNSLNVKREPLEHFDTVNFQTETSSVAITDTFETHTLELNNPEGDHREPPHLTMPISPQAEEPLGGLNLLCALAEQRIQEEVQSSIYGNQDTAVHPCFSLPLSSPTTSLPPPTKNYPEFSNEAEVTGEGKKKKHKHSRSKSNKKSRYSKKNKKKCSKEKRDNNRSCKSDKDKNCDDIQEDLQSAFKKVDTSYKRFGKWPNPEEIFKAMESDMRMRLADITRQYRKKKRKLEEIKKNKKKRKNSTKLESPFVAQTSVSEAAGSANTLTPPPPVSLCENKFSQFTCKTISHTKPNFLFADKTQTQSNYKSNFPPEDCANQLNDSNQLPSVAHGFKQTKIDLVPALSSSTVENIIMLSVQNEIRHQNACTEDLLQSQLQSSKSNPSGSVRAQKHASSEISSQSSMFKERKLMATETGVDKPAKKANTFRISSTANKEEELQTDDKIQKFSNTSQHHIDQELVLTSEHLYRKETRVLTDMGGLFYAGILKPLQPPDVYAITLDGERGNKSHIMSREEIFKDTILEVAPNNIESVPVGTRLCAYWSQQYRCLYPGRAIESEFVDGISHDFVSVEFDDGDSGRIRLQNIRFLLSDYPIVEYNDNPSYSLGKQKKSTVKSSSETVQEKQVAEEEQQICNNLDESGLEMHTTHRSEKKRIKSLRKKSLTCGEASDKTRKHRKHKKRKKHKKHHHRKSLNSSPYVNSPAVVNKHEENLEDTEDVDNKATINVTRLAKQQQEQVDNLSKIDCNLKRDDILQSIKLETTPASAKVKTEQFELEEETTSNLMSEVSDEIKADDEVDHNNGKGSKIAAFLPERQLWGWLGQAYRKAGQKGRARKQFYKSIKRGRETITVGDCAVFLSTGRPDRPYIGRIESMWETVSSNKVVRVRWFYHPEETTGCPHLKYPGALFESPHEDENDVQTISHRCEVLPFSGYFAKFGSDSKQYQSIYDNNDTYYLSGYYNPRLQVLKLQEDIPALEEKRTNV